MTFCTKQVTCFLVNPYAVPLKMGRYEWKVFTRASADCHVFRARFLNVYVCELLSILHAGLWLRCHPVRDGWVLIYLIFVFALPPFIYTIFWAVFPANSFCVRERHFRFGRGMLMLVQCTF